MSNSADSTELSGPEALEFLARSLLHNVVVDKDDYRDPCEVANIVRGLYRVGCPRVNVVDEFTRRRGTTPGWDKSDEGRALAVHLPSTLEARWATLDYLAESFGRAGRMLPSQARHLAENGGVVLVCHID